MSTENSSTDMDKKCRICLQMQSELQLHSFFDEYFGGFSLAQMFTNITSYQIPENEQLPKNICALCKNSIVNFNNMLSIFHETEILLKKQISELKIENYELSVQNAQNIETDSFEDNNYFNDDMDAEDIKSEDEDITEANVVAIKSENEHWSDTTKKLGANSATGNITETNVEAIEIKNEHLSETIKKISSSSGNGEYKSTTSFKYTCECGDCFLHRSGFRQHMQSRHDRLLEETDFDSYSEEINLKIPVGFPNNIEYVSSKVTIRKKKLQCRVCGTSFPSEQDVKDHEEIHKTFICDHCGAAFLKKNYLSDHLRIHSEERRYTCNICGKTFKHRYTYRVHKISHDVTRDFVCDTCGADFKTKGTLHTHMRIKHSNVRNYPCPNCNLRFNLKSTLDKHFLRKHTTDRKKSFICSKCGAAYLNKNTLTRHVTEKHLGMAKYYPCSICDNKMYVMKKGLRTHMLKKHGIVYQ